MCTTKKRHELRVGDEAQGASPRIVGRSVLPPRTCENQLELRQCFVYNRHRAVEQPEIFALITSAHDQHIRSVHAKSLERRRIVNRWCWVEIICCEEHHAQAIMTNAQR